MARSSLRLRGVRAAMNTWSEHAELRAESERRLRSAAKVFMADGVRKAFNSWSAVSSSRAVMHRALAIFTQRHLAMGFSTWASAAESSGELQRCL